MFRRRNGETGITDKEADEREISTAMGSKRNEKTALMVSETILRKIMSGVVQVE